MIDKDIEDSLDSFNKEENVLLGLTRYDGIDLVGCPLLLFWHVPSAVNLQELFLSKSLGEQDILRARTRTRIIQGLGRCTRRDRDRTLVLLIGNDFSSLLLDRFYLNYFPNQLKAEIKYGLEWSEMNYDELRILIEKFKKDSPEWQNAFSEILNEAEEELNEKNDISDETVDIVQYEIDFMRSLWSSGYDKAIANAESLINNLNENFKIYRAWWNYLAGHASFLKYYKTRNEDLLKKALDLFNRCREDSVESAPIWIHNFFDEASFIKIKKERNELILKFQRNCRALLIGVDKYDDKQLVLNKCVKDTSAIKEVLSDPSICGYPENKVTILKDATKNEIEKGLKTIISNTDVDSTVFIYFSGHGCHDGDNSYLLPKDVRTSDLKETAISGEEFSNFLSNIKSSRLVVVLDACHSGGLIQTMGKAKDNVKKTWKQGLTNEYIKTLGEGRGRFVIASSRDDEESYILDQYSCSLFTHHFCEALKGKTSSGQPIHDEDGFIRIFPVFTYVSSQVRKYQHPFFSGGTTDFPIALYQGGKID